MKRRTLDLIISTGGLTLAALLVVVGVVIYNDANFADDYTASQLGAENITFKSIDELTDAETAYTNARTGCLITYAGQLVTTGKQAECYANELIGGHLRDPDRAWKGLSYAELGSVQADLRAQIADAEAAGASDLDTLEEELAAVGDARETVFKGTMLRNSLLSAYGFSVLGDRAAQAATVIFVAAAILMILSIAGYVHAFFSPENKLFELAGTGQAESADRDLIRT